MTPIDANTALYPSTQYGRAAPHIPVLLSATLHYLSPQKGDSYLDLTAGYGGHAEAVLERTLQPARATLIDRDQAAANHLRRRFESSGARIINNDFLSASRQLLAQKAAFNLILADLGASSPQFDEAGRGFSFLKDGPLDMRMDNRQQRTAETVVNSYSRPRLEEVIRRYGQEPGAGAIASAIVASRPITRTTQLATIVAQSWRKRGRIHPATRTFQALRIEVNDELKQLAEALPVWLDLLAPAGRLVVISFHSLEDRIVKRFFQDHSGGYDAKLTVLTKKPIKGSARDNVYNPRARSAKLRAAAKK